MFTTLKVTLDGDGAMEDLVGRADVQLGSIAQLAILDRGTTEGNPSVSFRIECDDGSIVVAQTTWRLLHNAVKAVEARYGEPEGQA